MARPAVNRVTPLGELLLDHLWHEFGFATALDAALPASQDRAQAERAAFQATLGVAVGRPTQVDVADILGDEKVGSAMKQQAARRLGTGPLFVGPVSVVAAHLHGTGHESHHCRLRRRPWPGDLKGLDPAAQLTMTYGGMPGTFAFRPLPGHDGPRPNTPRRVTTAPCAVAAEPRPGELLLAGEHVRDIEDARRIETMEASVAWTQSGDELVVQPLKARPGKVGRSFVVRSEIHATRERECRNEAIGWLRTEIARSDAGAKHRLAGSAARRWVTFAAGGTRLKEDAIRDDAALDGRYLLRTTDTSLSDEELATTYLRFQDLAWKVARLIAQTPLSSRDAIWPALLLTHEAERRTGRPWEKIADRLDRGYCITFGDGSTTFLPLERDQRDILDRCSVHLP